MENKNKNAVDKDLLKNSDKLSANPDGQLSNEELEKTSGGDGIFDVFLNTMTNNRFEF